MNTDVIRIRDMMEDYARLCVSYAYGNNVVDKRDGVSDDIMAAVEAMASDRDALAAGVEEYHCRLPAHRDEAVLKAALEVTRRLKAASEPATAPAVPAATAELEPNDEYDLVDVKNNGEAWRYKAGRNVGEYTRNFPDGPWQGAISMRDYPILGTKFASMADAVRWWRATHPEPAEHAKPAKPSTLADRVRAMLVHSDGTDWGQTIDNLARAINAVARAVDELAKEAKP